MKQCRYFALCFLLLYAPSWGLANNFSEIVLSTNTHRKSTVYCVPVTYTEDQVRKLSSKELEEVSLYPPINLAPHHGRVSVVVRAKEFKLVLTRHKKGHKEQFDLCPHIIKDNYDIVVQTKKEITGRDRGTECIVKDLHKEYMDHHAALFDKIQTLLKQSKHIGILIKQDKRLGYSFLKILGTKHPSIFAYMRNDHGKNGDIYMLEDLHEIPDDDPLKRVCISNINRRCNLMSEKFHFLGHWKAGLSELPG